jgi:putative hydrolase of the HAD superfamily
VPRDDFFASLAKELFQDISADQVREHFETAAWLRPRLFAGIDDLLKSLRADGWRLGIITNGGVPAQSAKITGSGLSELVDGYVISSAFGAKKPAAEIFQHMLRSLAIDPAHSWYIGDHPREDIWGAKQVGFHTCWVERYIAWPPDLPRCYDARIEYTPDCLNAIAHAA